MTSVPATVIDAADEELSALESDHDVDVVLAAARVVTRGAAGPESDYDVGFVFVQSDLRRYAHVRQPPTTITSEADRTDVDLEFQGWDVRTFARLLADSNDGAIDLLRSPIRYRSAYEPDELAAYVERTVDPMDLYHAWRGIATNNYRKYVSHHLVRNDDETVPILETTDDGYVVEAGDGTTTVPADDERYAETQTRPTVKRNLTITRAAMYARYLWATGERSEHELPNSSSIASCPSRPRRCSTPSGSTALTRCSSESAGERAPKRSATRSARVRTPTRRNRSRDTRTRRTEPGSTRRVRRRDDRDGSSRRRSLDSLSASGYKVKLRRAFRGISHREHQRCPVTHPIIGTCRLLSL